MELVEAGIDYIACSMPADLRHIQEWEARAHEALQLISQHGNVSRLGSYQGYEGIHCAGAFVGSRDDGVHVHIPGSWAGRLYSQLHRENLQYSRLDLQVTVRFDAYDKDYGRKAHANASIVNQERPTSQRRRIREISEDIGGYTMYIGSRDSLHFCRLYDKGAQSSDPAYENCWRFEVQLNGKAATDAAQYLWVAARGQSKVACSTVWQYFNTRGVLPPWSREDEDNAILPQKQPLTDMERKLRWLREQVRPTIRLLREQVTEAILMEALGLQDDPAELPPDLQLE